MRLNAPCREKKMIIRIPPDKWGIPRVELINYDEKKFGLMYITNSRGLFEVIDKELFFLSIIKYGMEYEEIKQYSKTDYYEN